MKMIGLKKIALVTLTVVMIVGIGLHYAHTGYNESYTEGEQRIIKPLVSFCYTKETALEYLVVRKERPRDVFDLFFRTRRCDSVLERTVVTVIGQVGETVRIEGQDWIIVDVLVNTESKSEETHWYIIEFGEGVEVITKPE